MLHGEGASNWVPAPFFFWHAQCTCILFPKGLCGLYDNQTFIVLIDYWRLVVLLCSVYRTTTGERKKKKDIFYLFFSFGKKSIMSHSHSGDTPALRRHGDPVPDEKGGERGPPSAALLDESKMRPLEGKETKPTGIETSMEAGKAHTEGQQHQERTQRQHGQPISASDDQTNAGIPSVALLDESKMRKPTEKESSQQRRHGEPVEGNDGAPSAALLDESKMRKPS